MPYSFSQFHLKADKVLEHLQQELNQLRTGRATVQLLDSVRVEAYGSLLSLQEVAQVSAVASDLLVIKPWDKSLLNAVEKAIQVAGINLQAVVDKDLVRVPVPPLTEERRKEMVKALQQKIEQAKVMLRNVRGDIKKEIEKLADQDGVSEDEIKQYLDSLEQELKKKLDSLEAMFVEKRDELMTV